MNKANEAPFKLNLEWVEVWDLRRREAILRKRERNISAAIEKAGMDFMKTFKVREKITDRVEELERKLFDEFDKVTFLKTRKSREKSPEKIHREEVTARALKMAAEGHVDEAWALMKTL